MIRGVRAYACFPTTWLFGTALLVVFAAGCSQLPTAPNAQRTAGARSYAALDDAAPALVMMVRPGVSPEQVAAQYGGTVVGVVSELGIYRVALPTGDDVIRCATAMSSDSRVAAAEVNGVASIVESRQSSVAFSEGLRNWKDVGDQRALTRVGAPRAQTAANGNGVLVAILDTGISLDHAAFAGRLALPGIELGVTVSPGAERLQQVDSNHDGIMDGAIGHGTHVAGIVLAVAPKVRLLPVRVLDSDGVGSAFGVANGIVQATLRGARVINMSLGMNGTSTAVQVAIRYARDHGAVVVAPTGNDRLGRPIFPAAMPEVIAVAGVDSLDRHASFTNFGTGTDLAAPSTGILSTYYGGGYARWSGTSMAAPFVSGAAALLYGLLPTAGPGTPAQVEDFLLAGAFNLTTADAQYAPWLGAGRVDAAASLNALNRAPASMDGALERQR